MAAMPLAALPRSTPPPADDAMLPRSHAAARADAGGDLLRNLLMLDPRRRTTARAALEHPYFANIVSVLRNPPCLV
eukprot:354292-Chlamydomonas_euryale.AAC.3